MIVSTAIVVLPVLRSPMISSRWPRPIGVIASIDLMPVCNGSCTGFGPPIPRARVSTPGAIPPPISPGPAIAPADDLTATVDRLAERVDDPTQHRVTNRHAEDAAGRLHGLAFFNP